MGAAPVKPLLIGEGANTTSSIAEVGCPAAARGTRASEGAQTTKPPLLFRSLAPSHALLFGLDTQAEGQDPVGFSAQAAHLSLSVTLAPLDLFLGDGSNLGLPLSREPLGVVTPARVRQVNGVGLLGAHGVPSGDEASSLAGPFLQTQHRLVDGMRQSQDPLAGQAQVGAGDLGEGLGSPGRVQERPLEPVRVDLGREIYLEADDAPVRVVGVKFVRIGGDGCGPSGDIGEPGWYRLGGRVRATAGLGGQRCDGGHGGHGAVAVRRLKRRGRRRRGLGGSCGYGGCEFAGIEERVKGDAGVVLELGADLLADLAGDGVLVGQVEVLDEAEGELVGGDDGLVQVPEEDVAQLVGHRQLAGAVEGGVGVGRGLDEAAGQRVGGGGHEGGHVDVDADGDEGDGQGGLGLGAEVGGVLGLGHPVAPDALQMDGGVGVLADLVAGVGPRGAVLAARVAGARGAAAVVVVIVVVVVVAVLGVVDDGGAALGGACDGAGRCRLQDGGQEGVVVRAQTRRVARGQGLREASALHSRPRCCVRVSCVCVVCVLCCVVLCGAVYTMMIALVISSSDKLTGKRHAIDLRFEIRGLRFEVSKGKEKQLSSLLSTRGSLVLPLLLCIAVVLSYC